MDQRIRMFLIFIFMDRIRSRYFQNGQFLVPETKEARIMFVDVEVKVNEYCE